MTPESLSLSPQTPCPLRGAILVVDDSVLVAEMVAGYLSELGWRVDVATSGSNALKVVARSRPDVVVCDLHMPEMDGVEVLRQLREIDSHLPVVILSQDQDVSAVLGAVREGAFDYVVKGGKDIGPLTAAIDRAASHVQVLRDNARLADELRRSNEDLERRVAERTAVLEATLQELSSTQEQLVLKEKMATLGVLSAGVAHEINNPAAFVMTNLEVSEAHLGTLARLLPAPGVHAEAGRIVATLGEMTRDNLAGMKRIQGIVKSLRAFAAIQPEDMEEVSPNDVIQLAAGILRTEVRHRARLVLDLGEVTAIAGDRLMLTQVFVNLLVNAAQAIPPGAAEGNQISVSSRQSGGQVVVAVSDTGCGIPDEVLPRIFDPFFTTRRETGGTGLGLSICADIVRKHGGTIAVHGHAGRGSRFEVRLPARSTLAASAGAAAPPPPRAEKASDLAAAPRRLRILIVDDEPMLLQALRRLLRELDVVTCNGGREALRRLEQDSDFDVILCDLMMPDIDGPKLRAALADRHPALASRMIFCSGGAFTPEAKDFVAGLTRPLLAKPIDKAALLAAIDDLISTR